MTIGKSLSIGFSRWGQVFAIGFLIGVVCIPLIVDAVIQIGFRASAFLSGPALFAYVYVIFLIFLFGRFFLAFPVTVLEDLGPIDSLRASWSLTRGHFWRCAAIITVVTILAYLLFLLVIFLVGALGYRSLSVGQFPTTAFVFGTLALGLVNALLLTPLVTGAILSTYYDLKLRKEGDDLVHRVEALDSSQR
jgi:membrane-anchored glycerophosphoryl diester phosphodiesterase (GDPDase)